jgi:hypothetical protein
MNQNVGASFGLSVLVVLFFAVALYQPDRPPPSPTATAQTSPARPVDARPPAEGEPTPSPAVDRSRRPATTPALAGREPTLSDAPGRVVPSRRQVRPEPTPGRTVARVSHGALARADDAEPRGAFTEVRDGETLGDVASRVYGEAGEAEALWLANRDVLDRADAPLRPGTMLRTP